MESGTEDHGTSPAERFRSAFRALTGNPPFPWQEALFARFSEGEIPDRCDVPTGLGKTCVIVAWLLALAERAAAGKVEGFPRRLVYVVNRRTVVDQATREAEGLREQLVSTGLESVLAALRGLAIRDTQGLASLDVPLGISTLRGAFADNAEWRTDPARPSIIVGTVDMIGSRLLFSGYGRGFKTKPLHAGFLGQGTLLVHDEAHLEPAFQDLLRAIATEQQRAPSPSDGFGRLRVMALSATSRGASAAASEPEHVLSLSEADRAHPIVRQRVFAKKALFFHEAEGKKTAERIAELALAHEGSDKAILVFARTIADLEKVLDRIEKKAPERTAMLSGTMRGWERERLVAENPVFARFDKRAWRDGLAAATGTVYLVCTSAGEVGIDISADHLVCDLAPFDSLAQRLGRVNRYGEGEARVDVVCPLASEQAADPAESAEDDAGQGAFEKACSSTQALLRTLPVVEQDPAETASPAAAEPRSLGLDVSPHALGALPEAERLKAFSPAPRTLPLTGILLDAWALTTVREPLPGRPAVADWLHGERGSEPPETHVGWREEVGWIRGDLLRALTIEALLDEYPLKPHELLRDQSARVLKHLEALAARRNKEKQSADADTDLVVWEIRADGARDISLRKLLDEVKRSLARNKNKHPLDGSTVLLPPDAGALDIGTGRLDGDKAFEPERRQRYDVADLWGTEKDKGESTFRRRVWDEGTATAAPAGMRLVRKIQFEQEEAENEADEQASSPRVWRWYTRPSAADDDGSRTALSEQRLSFHLDGTERFAREIVLRLPLPGPEATAIVLAAKAHDLGKNRRIWQRSIGNDNLARPLAKSGKPQYRFETSYRHELGSLLDLASEPAFLALSPEMRDLVLHVVAAHHGRARPHFPVEEAFDPDRPEAESLRAVREVPRRFARLQRRYGRWGLAYLESLVRAADALASQLADPDPERDDT